MEENLHREKYRIVFRYFYILLFSLVFFIGYKETNAFMIICFLLYIINNQIRYFILPKENIYLLPSIIIEIIFSYVLCRIPGNMGAIVFVPVLLDIAEFYKAIFGGIYIVAVIILLLIENISGLMFFVLAAFPVFIFKIRIKDVEIKKIEAQDLYDKLREKDEELKKANEELESYASTIEEITVLRERNRISREIHDNVGHALSTIIIQLGAIEKICIKDGNQASEMAKNLGNFAKESMERVRSAVMAMKPREFEEYEGVIAISEMIKNFEKLTGIEVTFRVSDKVWKLNSDQTMVIYRIIQEFLSNSIRHGKATKVKIFFNFLEDSLRVHLKDNGIGCSKVIPGTGIRSIRERVAVWGGDIEYFTDHSKGFELIVTMEKVKLSLDGV